jgi:hypothetical protein
MIDFPPVYCDPCMSAMSELLCARPANCKARRPADPGETRPVPQPSLSRPMGSRGSAPICPRRARTRRYVRRLQCRRTGKGISRRAHAMIAAWTWNPPRFVSSWSLSTNWPRRLAPPA